MIYYVTLCFILIGGISFFGGIIYASKKYVKMYRDISDMNTKHLTLFILMCKWVKIKQNDKKINLFLEERNYKNVAIYGMGYVGRALYKELSNTNINVLFAIDNYIEKYEDLKVFKIDDPIPEAEIVIVTPITFYYEVAERLRSKIGCPIMSISELLDRTDAFQ